MTRLAGLDAKVAGDPFGLTNYDNLQADVDYLVVAGADLASAATLDITAEFHKVTGTTTVDNISDADTASAGQQVRLWVESGLTIRNNGGGAGNIRTLSGSDLVVPPNGIVSFAYDGSYWRQQSVTTPQCLYATKTSSVSTSGTSFAAGVDVLASAISFEADGVSDYLVEISAPQFSPGANTMTLALNVDGSEDGQMAFFAGGSSVAPPLFARGIILAPAAGTHTVNLRLWISAGSVSVTGGAGGSGNNMPIIVTVERAQ